MQPNSESTSQSNRDPAASRQHGRIKEALQLFNRGDFFECHEVLEAAWLETSGDQKLFLQGLIQVAVSFYHLRRANFIGSERLLRAALQKLSRGDGRSRELVGDSNYDHHGIDVPRLIAFLTPLPDRMQAGLASPEEPAPVIECRIAPEAPENSL